MQQETTAEGLILFGKPGCCLCDDAKPLVQRLATRHGLEYRVVSILDDSTLFMQYHDRIPVITYGGAVLDEGKVQAARLEDAFRRVRGTQGER